MYLTLTEAQFWVMILGNLLVSVQVPCLEDDVVEFQEKAAQARRAQKPEWIARYDPDPS